MSAPVTRRRFLDSGLALSGLAATIENAAATPAQAQDDAGADGPPLRQLLARLRSAAGAAMVGFALPGGVAGGTVQRKLGEQPSILDFGAVADDRTDNAPALQRAIDSVHRAGGGTLLLPVGTFLFREPVRLRPQVRLQGSGTASILHFVNAARGNALYGKGMQGAPLRGVALRDFTLLGDARFARGTPDVINGCGVILTFADECETTGLSVIGFSDAGIAFLDGNRNSATHCHVDQTAQGISFLAAAVSVTGNLAIGNRITRTGEYNGLHLEGGFGGKSRAEVRHTSLVGNTVSDTWEAGINIELAPYTSCVGNTVERSGQGRSDIAMGIKVYGGYGSAVCGNTVTGSSGFGLVIGANSGNCAVSGNVTAGNRAALLLTDSGAQVSNDVVIGGNAFTEGDIETAGNVRTLNSIPSMRLRNRDDPDPRALDWYEEGRFDPAVEGNTPSPTPRYTVRDGRFTRIGNVVHVSVSLGWRAERRSGSMRISGLPYAAAAAGVLAASWRTATGEVAGCARIEPRERRLTVTAPPAGTGEYTLSVTGQYLAAT